MNRELAGRRISRWFILLFFGLALFISGLFLASQASASPEQPEVVCLNYATQEFSYRTEPAKCDYFDSRAPLPPTTALALVITRRVQWSHWGKATAFGRGQYHPKGAGYWTPARVKLSRPTDVCGRQVFTSIQVKLKFPGKRWPKRWGHRTPLKSCIEDAEMPEPEVPEPELPEPDIPEPDPPTPGTDPQYSTCKAAIAAGYGPYYRGVDPEYDWYRDADSDGIVCER